MTSITRSLTTLYLAAGLVAAGLALHVAPAAADLVVTRVTNAPALSVGTKLPDDHAFELPAQSEVTLLRTPAGAQFVMRGEFKGTLEKFLKDCEGWLALTRAYCKGPTGDNLPIGGTRGVQQ